MYKYTARYSNELMFGFADYMTCSVTLNVPQAGIYSLVFAYHEGERLNNIDIVPFCEAYTKN